MFALCSLYKYRRGEVGSLSYIDIHLSPVCVCQLWRTHSIFWGKKHKIKQNKTKTKNKTKQKETNQNCKIVKYRSHVHNWYLHGKCIKMSTNMPISDPAVLEITFKIFTNKMPDSFK